MREPAIVKVTCDQCGLPYKEEVAFKAGSMLHVPSTDYCVDCIAAFHVKRTEAVSERMAFKSERAGQAILRMDTDAGMFL